MGMNLPPIEELSKKAGNKYRLCSIASKRAIQIQQREQEMKTDPSYKEPEIKELSQAAEEIDEGKVVADDSGITK